MNKPKQNRTKQNKTKQNKTEQNRTKQNRTKQNRTEQNRTDHSSTPSTQISNRVEALVFFIKMKVITDTLHGLPVQINQGQQV